MKDSKIVKGYLPGSIGRVAELHGEYYSRHWGFGAFFEAKVAAGLAEFINRYDEKRDGFWTVSVDGRIEGSIAVDGIDAAGKGAHLRWFIIAENFQQNGMGTKLFDAAIGYCRSRDYRRVYLWTFEGLTIAGGLYRKYGFELVEQHPGDSWGTRVNEQRFELRLG